MKLTHKILLPIIILTFQTTFVTGQNNEFISRLKTQLLLYRMQKVDQTIVLQTDKTLYRPGETIWMKAYVTDAITHLLSLKSLELSIQLTDNKGVNLSEGKYPLKNGVTDCNFLIPADLQSDVYCLIAYTPEMESTGIQTVFRKKIFIGRPEHLDMIPHLAYSKSFFAPERKETASLCLKDFAGKPVSGKKFEYQIIAQDREILSGKGKTGVNGTGEIVFLTPSQQNGNPIMVSLDISSGNDRLNLLSKIPLVSDNIKITFFPDGGQRVPGIQQMIVYEAKDQLGNPVDIKAEIISDKGETLVSTATIEPGLGVFNLLNASEKKLTLRIISDIGKNQETALPPLSPGSMSLTVKNSDGKDISLMLVRSPKSELARFTIIAASKGEMIWASDFEFEQAGVIKVPIEKFNSEFAAVAVFSDLGTLVAQRLIYTGKSQPINITILPDKSKYKKGEEGAIRVKVTGQDGKAVKAEFAVSLADKYAFPSSTRDVDVLKYGLDLPITFKEPLEKANRIALDYHLATNRLKSFDWNQVMSIEPSQTPNMNIVSMRISGTVVDTKDLRVPNALVSLTSSSLQQFNARSDQRGEFVINLPVSVEKTDLSASATDGSGKGNYRVILNKSFKDELVNSLNNKSVNDWSILEQLVQSNYFKENPDFFKTTPLSKIRSGDKKNKAPYWTGYLDGTTNLLEIIKTIKPYELINGKIVFRGANSFIAQDGALIVLDGQKLGTDATQLLTINPPDVEDIQILLNPVDMSRYTALNSVGIIEIKTKRGIADPEQSVVEDNRKKNTPKNFKPESIGNDKYNLKTTLLWIPVLFTDENGEATITFKTGGIKSTFILEIAGYTDQGQWIGNQSEIRVE